MRTTNVIQAEMRSVNDQLKAKIAELDTAAPDRILTIQGEYDALIRRWDTLAAEERSAHAEARSAHVGGFGGGAAAPAFGAGARATGALQAQRREGIENALLHRSNPGRYALTDAGRQYRGLNLVELGREVLEDEGVAVRGMSKPEITTRALQSTSDFPNILADVTSKTLRDSYTAAPRTFQPIAKQVNLKDYKPSRRVQLGAAPALLEIPENGEYKRGSMNEGSETIQLRPYGRIVGITRQVILNDDVGAFTDVPEQFGAQAANLESDIVWAMLLSNPILLTDGTAVFSAGHHNVGTGGASALAAAGLSSGRIAMAKQLDPDGRTVLNLRPKFAVVPPELETPLGQLLFNITPNSTAAAVPDSLRSLTPIVEPRLSTGVNGVAGSATAWYLFADPAAAEVIAYAYLEGQAGPYTETRNGFDIDGVEVKCRHDFGAAATDYRGAYRAAGA